MPVNRNVKFTDKYLQSLKPQEGTQTIREGRGFAIVVLSSGFKKFVYIYTLRYMRHQMNLGAYPAVTLAEARERYNAAFKMVQRKEDPQAVDKELKPKDFVEFIIVPAKVGIQIGERKRYFNTEAEALAAHAEFTAKHSRVKGTRAKSLTPEQKAAKAQARIAFEGYASRKGLEGKRVASLVNMLEDLCADVPSVHALIEAFVATSIEEQRRGIQ